MKKWLLIPVALSAALALAAAALGGGGTTIAIAPPVPLDVQQSSNTADGAPIGSYYYDFWKVQLIAGDHLTVKFDNATPDAGVDTAAIYEAGTDDFNFSSARYWSQDMQANAHAQLDFDAPSTGMYPLAFYAYQPNAGTYDFMAHVIHKARLAWNVTRVRLRGRIAVQAHFPDGSAVTAGLGATLYGYWGKAWHTLGKAAVANGTLGIPYSLPKQLHGQRIKLSVKAGGPSFRAAALVHSVTVV